MMKYISVNLLNTSILIGLLLISSVTNAQHNHQAIMKKKPAAIKCLNFDIKCAKTVTSAFSPNGDLWRLWALEQKMFFQISKDNGQTFSPSQQVNIPLEKISARNENRPKIAFDKYGGVYLSWASPLEKKYTANVRFSYSEDYGKSFSKPVTVNNDNLLTGHSFNEMQVNENGDVKIVWLDSRLSYQLKKQGKKANGSALYYAKANLREGIVEFKNEQLANETCVCCRIAMDVNKKEELAIFWRHIYGDNIREFALLTLDNEMKRESIQISNDHWKIDGCPHQGGGISIDQENRYHLVWFNQGDKGKGIFYASSKDQGKTLTKPLSVGDFKAQAAHPHIMQNNNVVDIVWTQFNGIEHQLWHQQSIDNGKTFARAKEVSQASSGSDRPFIIKKGGQNYVSWQRPKQGHLVKAL
ncbi:MAG: exo-alpha-sialidase [Colwelliaceae bacterium]|nr:exo-alpha-sialidase [Colwelliaceae bacterium]